MMRLFIFFLSSLLGLAAPPEFSGVWRLDVEKSQFDRQAPPRVAVDRIEHHEPYLVMHSIRAYGDAQETSGTARYRIGGEGENEVLGNRMRYAARWDGETLELVTKGSFGDNAIVLTDRYSLSADGKSLTLKRHYEGRGGPQDQTLILRREK